MKVSFLVTYYNQKQFVKQSLDSILDIEKPCDWEILVGDDGSTDGTIELVKEYMDRYPENIFLYVMDREPGKVYDVVLRASANRLNLVKHMSGDFFCTLDGDDYYCHTGFISKALEIFSKEPGLSAVAFGYQRFSEKGGILSQHTLPAGKMLTGQYLSKGLFTHAGSCVFKNFMSPERQAFLARVAYFDDNNILINNLFFGSMFAVEEIIYAYRQTESSIYNSMSYTEKAILNTQSYDVDMLLLPDYAQELGLRYGYCLLHAYFMGKDLKKFLGDRKWEYYLAGCQMLDASVTVALLDPDHATAQQKQQLRRLIRSMIHAHPKSSFITIARCWKRRIFG